VDKQPSFPLNSAFIEAFFSFPSFWPKKEEKRAVWFFPFTTPNKKKRFSLFSPLFRRSFFFPFPSSYWAVGEIYFFPLPFFFLFFFLDVEDGTVFFFPFERVRQEVRMILPVGTPSYFFFFLLWR